MASYIRLLIRKSMEKPTPFWSDRIGFVENSIQVSWQGYDYKDFEKDPDAYQFDQSYVDLVNGRWPGDLQTNKMWFKDVDHLYGALQSDNHWMAYHADLREERIDCYDSIVGHVTPESKARKQNFFQPLLQMIPALLDRYVPHDIREPTGNKSFAFRWMDVKHVPQNYIRGDCGVFAAKYMECLALGIVFYGINDDNVQGIRARMAVDLFEDRGYKTVLDPFSLG